MFEAMSKLLAYNIYIITSSSSDISSPSSATHILTSFPPAFRVVVGATGEFPTPYFASILFLTNAKIFCVAVRARSSASNSYERKKERDDKNRGISPKFRFHKDRERRRVSKNSLDPD